MGKPVPLFLRCQGPLLYRRTVSRDENSEHARLSRSKSKPISGRAGCDLALEHVASVVHERTAIIT